MIFDKAHAACALRETDVLNATDATREMKIRSDSLAANLTRLGELDNFFAFVATEAPAYKDMLAWLSERGLSTSVGAIHNLVTYHMAAWRFDQSCKASEEETFTLPANADEATRNRVKAMKFDLTMRDLAAAQQLTVWKLDLAERELQAKNQTAREAGVQALMAEAEGNPEAKAALAAFLAALDKAKAEVPA